MNIWFCMKCMLLTLLHGGNKMSWFLLVWHIDMTRTVPSGFAFIPLNPHLSAIPGVINICGLWAHSDLCIWSIKLQDPFRRCLHSTWRCLRNLQHLPGETGKVWGSAVVSWVRLQGNSRVWEGAGRSLIWALPCHTFEVPSPCLGCVVPCLYLFAVLLSQCLSVSFPQTCWPIAGLSLTLPSTPPLPCVSCLWCTSMQILPFWLHSQWIFVPQHRALPEATASGKCRLEHLALP